jgi:hypothetical protein
MIERRIPMNEWPLERLKRFLATHQDWEYVVSEYAAVWIIQIDKGGENIDADLASFESSV